MFDFSQTWKTCHPTSHEDSSALRVLSTRATNRPQRYTLAQVYGEDKQEQGPWQIWLHWTQEITSISLPGPLIYILNFGNQEQRPNMPNLATVEKNWKSGTPRVGIRCMEEFISSIFLRSRMCLRVSLINSLIGSWPLWWSSGLHNSGFDSCNLLFSKVRCDLVAQATPRKFYVALSASLWTWVCWALVILQLIADLGVEKFAKSSLTVLNWANRSWCLFWPSLCRFTLH